MDNNETVVPCTMSNFSDIRPCAAKLNENDLVTYSLMVSFVAPLCTYLERPPGLLQLLKDLAREVMKSFTFNEPNQSSQQFFIDAGKVIVSHFIPIYSQQFIDSQFVVFPLWALCSWFLAKDSSCTYAVVATLLLELTMAAVRLSFLSILFSITIINYHTAVLILRIITCVFQGAGCGLCYFHAVSLIFIFLPQQMLKLLDWIKNYGQMKSQSRNDNGQFSKRK